MQATDSLIEWSGTSRSTVGICEHSIHGVAARPPYSALFEFQSSGLWRCGEDRFAVSSMCDMSQNDSPCMHLFEINREGISQKHCRRLGSDAHQRPLIFCPSRRLPRFCCRRWPEPQCTWMAAKSKEAEGNSTKGLCTRLKLRPFVHLSYS